MFDIGGGRIFFGDIYIVYMCVHMPVFNVCKAQS